MSWEGWRKTFGEFGKGGEKLLVSWGRVANNRW